MAIAQRDFSQSCNDHLYDAHPFLDVVESILLLSFGEVAVWYLHRNLLWVPGADADGDVLLQLGCCDLLALH